MIKNSVEAIGSKEGVITIDEEVKGEEVEIRVKDNGKGMPKQMVAKLGKGEKIGTTKEDGHGIGMQQVMNTIKAMNGKIKIESKEDIGTEFILTFPKSEKPMPMRRR